MFTYILINIFTILIPILYSFERKVCYVKKWKALFPALLVTSLFFLVWDCIFTAKGIWGFHKPYLIGINIGVLPLEEILFFFCIPFSCVFIYEIVSLSKIRLQNSRIAQCIFIGFIIILLATAFVGQSKIYTLTVCLTTAAFLIYKLKRKPLDYFATFHLAFGICLIPFLIVNGILTRGLNFIDQVPVVWYDSGSILNIRVMTIPLEDFIYCYLLLYMNITFYEHFKEKLCIKP